MYKTKLPLLASKEKHVGKKHYLFQHKDLARSVKKIIPSKDPKLRFTDKTFFLANTLINTVVKIVKQSQNISN
jgi:hypothetical protein